MTSPAEKAIAGDLASARFRAGVARGQWQQLSYQFPILLMAVASVETDGSRGEYYFRYELNGFPGIAPLIQIWDRQANTLLPPQRRPRGSGRLVEAFKVWQSPTVYRPWERLAGAHFDWTRKYPALAWHSGRDLAFTLEDLHGLLTSNAAACSPRPAA